MNLGKLFNFKYLKQNVKKSKGLLTVLTLLIPVITVLILIANNSSKYPTATYPITVVIANVLGMYVIPVIISYILYGYVYKKNSEDFVNSMPLTRSTIFTTNFICGICIIFIIQLLTAFVTVIAGNVLSCVVIAGEMIFDLFIVMFLAYSFVFSATSLAMTVSGNYLTQIVVSMLIVFLIPFIFGFSLISVEKVIDIEVANQIVTIEAEKVGNYTLPSGIVLEGIGGNTNFYSVLRNVKTLVLIIAYYGIGLYLFNKRKMENVGTSFSKLWVHLLVKGITLVPMVFVIEMLELDTSFFAISVVLVFIYYFLYDFITSRKVPVRYTLLGFALSFVVLIGAFKAVQFSGEKFLHETISVDDIKGISIADRSYTGASSFYYNGVYNHDIDVYLEDETLINEVCSAIHSKNNENYWSSADWSQVALNLKLKNGSKRYATAIIKYDVAKEAVQKIRENDEYINKYKEISQLPKNSYIMQEYKFLSKEDNQELIRIFNSIDVQKKIEIAEEFSDYGNRRNYIPQPNFKVYYYKNHDLQEIELNPFLSQELFDKMNEISKKNLMDNLVKAKTENDQFIYANINEKRVNTQNVDMIESVSFDRTDNLIRYIEEHVNEKINMNDKFYIINLSTSYTSSNYIFLKETDELDDIIQKDKAYHIYYEEGEYPENYYDDLKMEKTLNVDEVVINE